MLAARNALSRPFRLFKQVTGAKILSTNERGIKKQLWISLAVSIIILLICGVYGGSCGHATGSNVVEIWLTRHDTPMEHPQLIVSLFTGFYIMLMTTAGMAAVGYLALLVSKRYHIFVLYCDEDGHNQLIENDELRGYLAALIITSSVAGVVGGVGTYFGIAPFIDSITR